MTARIRLHDAIFLGLVPRLVEGYDGLSDLIGIFISVRFGVANRKDNK